jgi:hypothetical protein
MDIKAIKARAQKLLEYLEKTKAGETVSKDTVDIVNNMKKEIEILKNKKIPPRSRKPSTSPELRHMLSKKLDKKLDITDSGANSSYCSWMGNRKSTMQQLVNKRLA